MPVVVDERMDGGGWNEDCGECHVCHVCFYSRTCRKMLSSWRGRSAVSRGTMAGRTISGLACGYGCGVGAGGATRRVGCGVGGGGWIGCGRARDARGGEAGYAMGARVVMTAAAAVAGAKAGESALRPRRTRPGAGGWGGMPPRGSILDGREGLWSPAAMVFGRGLAWLALGLAKYADALCGLGRGKGETR